MKTSTSNRYILTVRFGNRHIHGLHIYNEDEVIAAKERLIAVGAKPCNIRVDTYESVFGGGLLESEVVKRAV